MPRLSGDTNLDIHINSDADTSGVDRAHKSVESFEHTAKSSKLGDYLSRGFQVATVAATGLGAAMGGITAVGFGFNSSVEQAQTKIQAFTKSTQQTAELLAWAREEAAKTQFSFTDMSDAVANLIPASKMSGVAVKDLVRQAETLAALNPSEGLVGAAFSIREALSGDFVSIVERFNLPRQRLNELRQQGVPAMKAIETALREMGIEYSLVAEQGKTTAARWDQIKDKFTMLAGAVTKPIFDVVSRSLEEFANNTDWQEAERQGVAFTNNLIAGTKQLGETFGWLVGKATELGVAIWSYLGPKVTALWTTFSTQLLPTLQRLWNEVLAPLIPVIGVLLVGALGLALDATNALLQVLIPFGNWMVDNKEVVLGIAAAIGTLWIAMKSRDAIEAFMGNFNLAKAGAEGAIGAMKGSLASLNGALTGFGGWAVFAAVAVGAISMVIAKFDEMNRTIRSTQDAIAGATASNNAALQRAREQYQAGKISKERYNQIIQMANSPIPSFATGVQDFRGGLAYVHQGEMLVNLPKGTDVIPRREVERGAQASNPVTFNNTYIINNQVDLEQARREQGFQLAHA